MKNEKKLDLFFGFFLTFLQKKTALGNTRIIIIIIMSGGENNNNNNKQMTTRERQQIEVAKLEAELNALKVDAAKVCSIAIFFGRVMLLCKFSF